MSQERIKNYVSSDGEPLRSQLWNTLPGALSGAKVFQPVQAQGLVRQGNLWRVVSYVSFRETSARAFGRQT
jgi:hypothetical protein